ncbi:MAG: methionine synthase, partial [Bacteroidales bacterium]|nr:methionine synthase [Bacteroidales bacterium]
EAKKLYNDAVDMITRIVNEELMVAEALSGIFPAEKAGDDVKVFPAEGADPVWLRFLRNQEEKETGHPNLCLSDFVAEKDDHAGVFVVTVKIKEEIPLDISGDDYNNIMLRILADRLAEAAAEWLHREIRVEQWGYAADERLTAEEMFKVKYKGIRPAPGYPACPDHTGKQVIFDLLKAPETIGITLTESFAMNPPASVCGYIFVGKNSSYFNVGRIDREQLEDYAKRQGMTIGEATKWLAPNL